MPPTLRRRRRAAVLLADRPDVVRRARDVRPEAVGRVVAAHRHGRAVLVGAAVGAVGRPVLHLGRCP